MSERNLIGTESRLMKSQIVYVTPRIERELESTDIPNNLFRIHYNPTIDSWIIFF